jgi:hypothetical protein
MDPLTGAVVSILGKYAIDKGATLLKEAGQAVADAAGKLFQKVMDRLKADPTEAKTVERFEKNPEAHAASVAEAVDEKVKSEPEFAAELKTLLEEVQKAERAAGVTITTSNATATASQGGAAVGSISVGGSLSGSVNVQGSGGGTPPEEKK